MAIAIGLDRKNSADFCLHSLLGVCLYSVSQNIVVVVVVVAVV